MKKIKFEYNEKGELIAIDVETGEIIDNISTNSNNNTSRPE